jgi:ArsR family transcriptional regulator
MLDRRLAETYAGWFRALADATRVQILNLLAERATAMTVGQIVARVPVGQSTVSAHLKVLTEARFVLVDRRGTASWYRVNQACVSCFPSAADVVMGRPATPFTAVGCDTGAGPADGRDAR